MQLGPTTRESGSINDNETARQTDVDRQTDTDGGQVLNPVHLGSVKVH